MKLPSIHNYGRYSSSNYGANSLALRVGRLVVFFSYETPVAFNASDGKGLFVCKNYWGPTTGKHLNWIDGGAKNSRLDREVFEAKFQEALKSLGLEEQ